MMNIMGMDWFKMGSETRIGIDWDYLQLFLHYVDVPN